MTPLTRSEARRRNIPCLLTSEALELLLEPWNMWSDLENLEIEDDEIIAAQGLIRDRVEKHPTWNPFPGCYEYDTCIKPKDAKAEHLQRIAWLILHPEAYPAETTRVEITFDCDPGTDYQDLMWGDGHHRATAMIWNRWEVIPFKTAVGNGERIKRLSQRFPESYRARLFRVKDVQP